MPIGPSGSSGGSSSPGFEISYTQITSNAAITDTAEATATALISPGAITFDGSLVLAHFFCPQVTTDTAGAGDFVIVSLFEGSTQIGRLCDTRTVATASTYAGALSGFLRFTPTAGSHTYKVTAFATSATGSPQLTAGNGGTGGFVPAFIRFTKV